MSLKDIVAIDAEDLDKDQITELRENKDFLGEEYQTKYKSVLEEPTEPPPGKKDPEDDDDAPTGAFKDEAEAEAFVQKAITADRQKQIELASDAAKKIEIEDPKVVPFFDKGYQPKNWEDYAQQVFPKFVDRMGQMNKAQKTKVAGQMDALNKKWDEETNAMAEKDDSIPKVDDEKRAKFDKDVADIALELDTGLKGAVEIYQLRQGKSGKDRKSLAGKVGAKGKGGGVSKEKKYKDIAGKDMDELIDEGMEENK